MESSDFADVSFSSTTPPPAMEAQSTIPPQASAEPSGVTIRPLSAITANRTSRLYSQNEGAVDKAYADCCSSVVDKSVDGDVKGYWLLICVDHWDNETEKLIILTEESLLVIRYDFIPMKMWKFRRLELKQFDTVNYGDFVYPSLSLNDQNQFKNFVNRTGNEVAQALGLNKRDCGGVKLKWNKGEEPGFLSRWNPKSDSCPWVIFTYHPLYYSPEEAHRQKLFSVEDFTSTFIETMSEVYTKHSPGQRLTVLAEPINQEVYIPLVSAVNNQSQLGISKERGGVSF